MSLGALQRASAWGRITLKHPNPQELVRITHAASETQELGERLGQQLQSGDVICLYGELGAGKTTFIQGLARGLGVTGSVVSPSFTLIHEHKGRLPLYHLDLYRLDEDDLDEIGLDEILAADAVVAIEWAERLLAEVRSRALKIDIAFSGEAEDERRIRISGNGSRGAELVCRLSGESDDRSGP